MMHIESLALTGQATFGRDGGMFESVLGFVAQLSLVLWGLVILTTVIRFVGIQIYRRVATGTALVETATPSVAVSAHGQLSDSGLARLGLVGSNAAEKDAVHTRAELADVLTTEPVKNATGGGIHQPAEVPAATAASMKMPRRAPGGRHAESRSPAHVPELAANSTRT